MHPARDLLLSLGWPAVASCSLAMAVGRGDPDPAGMALLACGTATAYGLDRWVDHRPGESDTFRRILLIAIAVTTLLGGLLAVTAWWRFQVCVLLGVISGAYVPLKRHIPKNILTSIAWTVGCCTLPFASAPDPHHAYWGAAVSVLAIMIANTVLCDIPDVAEDRRAGVRGITPKYGPQAGVKVVLTAGTAGVLAGLLSRHYPLALTAACFGPLAVLMGEDPGRTSLRKYGDLIVTLVPGPLSLVLQ